MKKPFWILLTCLAVLVASVWGLLKFQRRFWEATLWGPYTGVPYSGSITTAPVSVLSLPAGGQLEVHELASYTNPVLVLRSTNGTIQWSRLFRPEKQLIDGKVDIAGLRELRLRSFQRRSTGSVVFITCDWDWGGREGGMIDLDDKHAFRSFRLSW